MAGLRARTTAVRDPQISGALAHLVQQTLECRGGLEIVAMMAEYRDAFVASPLEVDQRALEVEYDCPKTNRIQNAAD